MRSALLLGLLPAALLLSGCIADPGPAAPTAGSPTQTRLSTGENSAPTTSAPLETMQSSNKAPVYWIGRSNSDIYLYREFRDVPGEDNPITKALRAMMSEAPLDPDFFTPWQNPKNLATSISGTNVITVDVSADAFNSNLDADMAQRAIQQLVYTATAAGASSGLVDAAQQLEVVILVDGHTDYHAFKHVQLGAPMPRSVGMVAPVWIIDPQEGVEVADGRVKINGRNTVPGGKLQWRLLKVQENGEKEKYLDGEATAATAADASGIFSVTVKLAPGDYEIRVSQIDPGRPDDEPNVDTRGFSVR
jgi:spore germination protein GerM